VSSLVGDIGSLTSSGNVVQDNVIENFGLVTRTYMPGVLWSGVGHYVGHNTIRNGPHQGISGGGNNVVFEHNTLHDLAYETSDTGAFYSGRRWDWRGNVLRNNNFTNIRARTVTQAYEPSVIGVYLDDEMSGYTIHNNTFDNVQTAILMGGGRNNTISSNRFKRCDYVVHFDARGEGCFNKSCYPDCPGGFCSHAQIIWDALQLRVGPNVTSADREAWLTAYPELGEISLGDKGTAARGFPGLPVYDIVSNNLWCKGKLPDGYPTQWKPGSRTDYDRFLDAPMGDDDKYKDDDSHSAQQIRNTQYPGTVFEKNVHSNRTCE
jgi:hypothetical protein